MCQNVMRILYIDIDTLRPDHLGCYGYHRNTSPTIDRLAAEGVRYENCYVSDAPCLPSRAAFYSGRFGIRNGAVNHGGGAADMYIDPSHRGFRCVEDHFTVQLREAGLYPVSISPFGERHSAFWFYNGFREMVNTGRGGMENADEVLPVALDWLDRRGKEDNWYLHVNFWDPHGPYRVPTSFGNPFRNDPLPAWMTEDIRQQTWDTYGPGCAQEPSGMYTAPEWYEPWRERQPEQIGSMEAYRKWIDGYDCGIRYADDAVGRIVERLDELGVLDDTLIVVSSDHGENQGELAVYGDHQTADHITNRVPLIVRHPRGVGGKGRVDRGLHYQFDWGATLLEMLGRSVPGSWDGQSFLQAFEREQECGRESLVVGNCAWACQRAARWDDYLLIRSYHTGFKNYPEFMLFNVGEDPHELNNLVDTSPALVSEGTRILDVWLDEQMRRAPCNSDPMQTVMSEGGPFHACFESRDFEAYKERLRKTGRSCFADELDRRKQGHYARCNANRKS